MTIFLSVTVIAVLVLSVLRKEFHLRIPPYRDRPFRLNVTVYSG